MTSETLRVVTILAPRVSRQNTIGWLNRVRFQLPRSSACRANDAGALAKPKAMLNGRTINAVRREAESPKTVTPSTTETRTATSARGTNSPAAVHT